MVEDCPSDGSLRKRPALADVTNSDGSLRKRPALTDVTNSDGSPRKRPALADVTNRQAKRGFVPLPTNSTGKNGSGCRENVGNVERNSGLVKKVFQGPEENSVKTKPISEFVEEVSERDFHLSKAKQVCSSNNPGFAGQALQANTSSGISRVPSEIKEPSRLVKINLCFENDEAVRQGVLKKGDAPKNSGTSSVSMHVGDGQCSNDGKSSSDIIVGSEKCKDNKEIANPDVATDVIELDSSNEELTTNIVGNDGEGMDDDDLTSNKSSSSLGLEPSASSSSKVFESETCMAFNGDGGSDSSTGLDLLKACSCSFCLKAAHIWSDLHYQDAKGRIAALKKSRKEVRSLVEKSSIPADFAKFCQGNSNKSMKLEFDLMNRWRSLFLHTEDILVRESNQLQSSLLTLKDLRGNCKADLEMITRDPSNKK
ncbi:hypothetical protein BVC80_1815g11 [Macleaya cordata]|uniref:Uncharacterized protein n=1 Tax=Macleaya cordata TaxID=56857 RepID=A0A200QVX0_MACCD|nr:hypothetical protein BVC80_1815g11 [Macleaya cordata]